MRALPPAPTPFSRAFLFAAALALALACGDSGPVDPVVAVVEVTPASDTLISRTGSVQLSASVTDAAGGTVDVPVAWTSSDESVATVDAGRVQGMGSGQVDITATADGVSGTARIHVGVPVGPAGGDVSSRDGSVVLTIPAGAFSGTVHVTLDDPAGLPATEGLVAGTAVEIGPVGTAFAEDARLLLGFSPGALPTSASPLSLRGFRREGEGWVKVGPSLPVGVGVESFVDAVGTYALLTDRLASASRTLLAAELTRRARDGLLGTHAPGVKPLALPDADPDLLDALETELGPERVGVVDVDPGAFERDPVLVTADDLDVRIFAEADPLAGGAPAAVPGRVAEHDPQIAAGVDAILDLIRSLDGFDLPEGALSDMEFAFLDTEFHEEGDQSGGIRIGAADEKAVSFPLGPADQFGLFAWDGGLVFVYDGHSHTVFEEKDAEDLRNGDILDAEGFLREVAATALHELIHITLRIRGREEKDDEDDLLVAALENALEGKINLELERQRNGTVSPSRVAGYTALIDQVIDTGGEDCLHLVGLPAPAEELSVSAPASVGVGETFTVAIDVSGAQGVPLGGEDVAVNQSHFDEAGEPIFGVEDPDLPPPVVVSTEQDGTTSVQIAATGIPGHINIVVNAAGRRVRRQVEVKASNMGEVSLAPDHLQFSHTVDEDPCPRTIETVELTLEGGEAAEWSVSGGQHLRFSPSSGTIEPGQSVRVEVRYDCGASGSFASTATFEVHVGETTHRAELTVEGALYKKAVRLAHTLSADFQKGDEIALDRIEGGRIVQAHEPYCDSVHLHDEDAGIRIDGEGPFADPDGGGCGYGKIVEIQV